MRWYQGFAGELDREGLDRLREEGRTAEEKIDGWFVALEIGPDGGVKYILRSERLGNTHKVCYGLPNTLPLKNTVLVGEVLGGTHNTNGDKGIILFDCPVWEGADMKSKPLPERREKVKEAIKAIGNPVFRLVKYVTSGFGKFYDEVVGDGGEGIVVKENKSAYIGNGLKLPNWYKVKRQMDGDYVILGYEQSDSASHIGQIRNVRCGLYNKQGKCVEVMTVGNMNSMQRMELTKNGAKYIGQVIVVKGYERFPDGALRHPSLSLTVNGQLVGNKIPLREDKKPEECVL